MDVKCEKCGTEYEFDDRKVAASGITVKCTNCDHLFRVARASASAPVPEREREEPSYEIPRPARSRWMIRNGSGQIREFKDLATLHQWIAQGKVSQSDEISKTGENWKPLSAIVELSALFTQTGLRAIPRSAPPGQPPPIAAAGTLSGLVGGPPPRANETSGIHRRPTDGGAVAAVVGGPTAPSDTPRPPPSGPGSTVLGMRVTPPPIQRALGGPNRSGPPVFDDTVRTPPPELILREREPSLAPGGPPPPRRDGGDRARVTGGLAAVRLPDQFEPSMGSMMTPLPAPAQLQTMGFGTPAQGGLPPPGGATPPPLPGGRSGLGTGQPSGGFGTDARSTGMHGAVPGGFGPAGQLGGGAMRSTGAHPAIASEGSGLSFSFDGEQPPPGARATRGGGGRGFATGVLASVALAGAGYFVYDMFVRTKGGPGAAARGTSASVDSSLLVRLDRAEDRYASDGAEGFAEAERLGQQVMLGLGEPPADPRLATRARLVVARAAIARAEYGRLEGESPEGAAIALASAERHLAEARAFSPEDGEVDLTYADLRRVQGDLAGARGALARAREHGAPTGGLALLEASLLLHTRTDDVALAERMAALPSPVLDLPRARYLLAVAQHRAGQRAAAEQTLRTLLADRRDHAPAQRLLAAIGQGGAGAAGQGTPVAVLPAAVMPAAVMPAAVMPAAPSSRPGSGAPPSTPPPTVAAAAAVSSASAAATPATAPPVTPSRDTVAAVEQVKAVPDAPPVPAAPASVKPVPPAAAARPAVAAASTPAVESFDALLRRGHRLLEQGRTGQARRIFLQAIEINGRSAEAWANLAWCDVDEGRHEVAIRNFGRALERNSRYADALYGLGMAYDSAGRGADARRAYQKYLDQHPSGRQAAMVRRKLDALK